MKMQWFLRASSAQTIARAALAALMLILAAPVVAQSGASGQAPQSIPWSSLSGGQQKMLGQFEKEWNSLSPERQQTLSRGSERWLKMTPDERKGARERFQRWQKMPAGEKRLLRERWQEFRSLSPSEQARVRENFRKFKDLSPEARSQLRERWNNATPAERKRMLERSRQIRRGPPPPKRHPRR